MDFLDSLADVEVEDAAPVVESVIIWTDEPKRALQLRGKIRAEGHKCIIRYAGAFIGAESRENDVEDCTVCLFYGAHKKDAIISAYRQLGFRNVVFKTVAVGSFGEPVEVPDIDRQVEIKLDPNETLASENDSDSDESNTDDSSLTDSDTGSFFDTEISFGDEVKDSVSEPPAQPARRGRPPSKKN